MICDVVWAEVFTLYHDQEVALRENLSGMNLEFSPLTRESSEMAASCWHGYRMRAGGRRRIAADFLIGAHAMVQGDGLLSRDSGFYRDYFNALNVIDPLQSGDV